MNLNFIIKIKLIFLQDILEKELKSNLTNLNSFKCCCYSPKSYKIVEGILKGRHQIKSLSLEGCLADIISLLGCEQLENIMIWYDDQVGNITTILEQKLCNLSKVNMLAIFSISYLKDEFSVIFTLMKSQILMLKYLFFKCEYNYTIENEIFVKINDLAKQHRNTRIIVILYLHKKFGVSLSTTQKLKLNINMVESVKNSPSNLLYYCIFVKNKVNMISQTNGILKMHGFKF